MFEAKMPLREAIQMGRERALEEMKFVVVQKIRAAGEDERNFSRQVTEINNELCVVAVPKQQDERS
ncbi:hypothetical protein FHS18_006871 [Paenibacillus phyllosphaerae]|uniref:Uncharacterized protein n=1 Tax=Paenibacillus phyllosphaerae TaxID=274593 RepID=A0A7W5B5G6_9BACL|nr:hypothetical protein [Paenibacillus phyllosphaerae]MBB3114728.1 hypothetical protein [Paenibacillus phyllosphaerae]